MKKIVLLALGLLPFLFGGALNWAMLNVWYDVVPPYATIGLIVLVLWGVLAHLFSPWADSPRQAVVLLNLPAAVVLLLLGIQEVVLGAYWMSAVGLWSQYFYLPLMRLGFLLTPWGHTVFLAYCAAFALMMGAAALGCHLRKKRDLT